MLENTQTTKPKWQKALEKIKHALPKDFSENISSAKVALHEDNYLRETSGQPHIVNEQEFKMHRMDDIERDNAMLRFDDQKQILVNKDGSPASTIGRKSKHIPDVLVFVMDLKGNIYVTEHLGYYNPDGESTNHSSILGGKPVEMAGLIKIDDGKIAWLSNNSGHYRPTPFDIYRGIDKLYKKYPEIFLQDAHIQIDGHAADAYTLLSDIEYNRTLSKVIHENTEEFFIKDLLQGIPVKHYLEDSKVKLPDVHESAIFSNQEKLKSLLSSQPDCVNMQDQFGNTPMHYALANHDLDSISLLTWHRGNANIFNHSNKTALDYARIRFSPSLIAHKAVFFNSDTPLRDLITDDQVNKQDRLGNTPLHYAIAMHDEKKILDLIELGAKFSIPNNSGQFPLDYTLYDTPSLHYETSKIPEVLNASDIDQITKTIAQYKDTINLPDRFGNTILDYAIFQKNDALTNILIDQGAEYHKEHYKHDRSLEQSHIAPDQHLAPSTIASELSKHPSSVKGLPEMNMILSKFVSKPEYDLQTKITTKDTRKQTSIRNSKKNLANNKTRSKKGGRHIPY